MAATNYRPDDAQITLAGLEFLRTADGARLRQAVADLPWGGAEPTVAQVSALRREFPIGPIHAALTLAKLQPKGAGARGKFPELRYVWATPEALEQATHITVGRYKAARFAELGARRVVDVCAGIGGDTLAFAERMPATAVELSPVRAACLQYNAADVTPPLPHPVDVWQQDIGKVMAALPTEAWVHIDPARRSEGKRSVQFADLMPGPEVLAQLFGGGRRGAVKLSSAVDFEALPALGGSAGHVELISHQGTVVQALWWIGTALPPAQRTATVLGAGGERWSMTTSAKPAELGAAPSATQSAATGPSRLYELDGAITRAGLAHALADALGLSSLTLDGGYLLGPASDPRPAESGLWQGDLTLALTPFDVRQIVPFARVGDALRALPDAPEGPVEVKARGNLPGIETDVLQRQWTRLHGRTCTVLLFRQQKETLAAVGFRADRACLPGPSVPAEL